MNAKFSKRLMAFIIDFIFISAVLMILSYFIPRGNDFDFLNNDMNELTEQALKGDITFSGYMREYANYMSELDSGNIMYNATSFIFLVIYFVIVPIFTKCTFGKYIMKIKLEHKDEKKVGILNIEATTNQACCACLPFNGIYNKYPHLFDFLFYKNYFVSTFTLNIVRGYIFDVHSVNILQNTVKAIVPDYRTNQYLSQNPEVMYSFPLVEMQVTEDNIAEYNQLWRDYFKKYH